jgi:formylglycine-generating enzyme required for sulfatase activity
MEWVPPKEIAEFRLERRLGRGATSEVWLARDTLLGRVVALKIANAPAFGDARTRFRVEARAVAKMQHPNLLAIHHVGEIEDHPFLVTEFLAGSALDAMNGSVDPDRVVAIGIDLARGLSAAHNAGVLHRDIKPANAFLCDDGVAKLLDFGLAKLSDGPMELARTTSSTRQRRSLATPAEAVGALDSTQPDLASSDRLAGTPLYMAPETWRGETATRATDVYSLGSLLFELVAGRPPIVSASIADLHQRVLAGDVDDLRVVIPSVPAALAAIVERCLQLDASERPTADEVCDALARVGSTRRSAQAEALDDPRENPYRGLLTFGPEHRALFFGREAETAAVTAELRASPFVLVAGVSGAGTSSLVRAGVVPRVEKGALGTATTRVVVVVPGRRPIDALAQAMAPVLGAKEADVRWQIESPTWLADETRAARAHVLLVVDQLEEIWTLADAEERAAFFAILAALTRAAPTVRTVATLRADFLERLEDMGELQAPALHALVVLRSLTREGLRRAIVEPALRRGVTVEDALVAHLIDRTESTASGDGGALPLLEFALQALYAQRDPARGTIGLVDLDALGGVDGALAAHADATLARLPTPQRREARRLLLALVTIERTRSRCEEGDLLGSAQSGDARAALNALVEARLVVAGAGEHGAAYSVAHEALLSGWPALRAWLDEEATAREMRDRVRRAAVEWERAGRAREALFGERQLGELDAIEGLEERDAAFVTASRAALRRARVRRWSLRLGAPVALLVAVVAIAVGTRWSERRQARAFVDARLAEAAPRMREVKTDDANVESARAAAFTRFDAGDKADGEARWLAALALAQRESDAFVAASEPLSLALARAPLDQAARAEAADLAYLWLLAAERDHETNVARDLLARVAQLDDDGSRRARIGATAHLRVTTATVPARVLLHAVRVDASGDRVEDEGRPIELGASLELTPGSYLLAASAPGKYPTRYPILLARDEDAYVDIPLPAAASVPPGFVFVAAGTSIVGATDAEAVRTSLLAEPEHAVHVSAFLIGAHEVTFAEYLEFLAALSPRERQARRPRAIGVELTYDRDGGPRLTLGATTTGPGEPVCLPKRTVRRCQDWMRFPVEAIAQDDARAYAAWLAHVRVPGARLCSEREWERAARGADGRLFPHGDVLRPGDANYDETYGSDDAQMGLNEVGSFPMDRSPFGVFDLAGNVTEWLELRGTVRTSRGGMWFRSTDFARASSPDIRLDERYEGAGVRVCADAPATL